MASTAVDNKSMRDGDGDAGEAETDHLQDGAYFQDDDDDNSSYNDDDGPEAEGDAPPPPKVEPSYELANGMKFFNVCKRLEILDQLKKPTNKNMKRLSEEEKLQELLPPQALERFFRTEPGQPPESIFPLMRLLLPEKDSSRHFGLKAKKLAEMYAKARGLSKTHEDYRKLFLFNDPNVVGTTVDSGIGEFDVVLQKVLEKRLPKEFPNQARFTVGEINELLDQLCNLQKQPAASNHDKPLSPNKAKKKKKAPRLIERQAQWVKNLNLEQQKQLSPLEHKWLVRILMGTSVRIGLGWKPIMNWYHPSMSSYWAGHNSLKGICKKLCNPEYEKLRQQDNEGKAGRRLSSYMAGSAAEVEFGTPFEPMCSERTGFDRLLNDVSKRHRDYAAERMPEKPNNRPLVLQHPAFTVETKLDGERMILHVSRDGIVKIQSRRARWYSELYSPVLGPAVRRAVGKYKMDIVLDGEVLAWDSGRNETVPFGNNRTIAILRHKWMKSQGLCDDRDKDVHKGDNENKVMTIANSFNKDTCQMHSLAGEECWLLFVAFDVVYIDGPGAAELLEETVSDCVTPRPSPGSLVGLDGFERKKILHKLLDVQKHEVEIVQTYVIRPNGRSSLGSDYFSATKPDMECGLPAYTIDSIECCLSGTIQDLEQINVSRRSGRAEDEISQARALTIQDIYKQTVLDQRMEGLVMKDLSAPYVLGDTSRGLKYWLKFKPDYYEGSVASDLDVVIIGAYFATGLRDAGRPSSYLCACVDWKDNSAFLPLCKVNAGSMDQEARGNFNESTGFSIDPQGKVQYGRWFVEDDRSLPEFISHRSLQAGSEDHDGWRFDTTVYPDLWIHPNDSSVLTLNAGEIVESDSFSVGLTLRFPRITRLRSDGDSKDPRDIESDRSIWSKYNSVIRSRQGNDSMGSVTIGSPGLKPASPSSCRFLTENQYATKKKTSRHKSTAPKRVASVVENVPRVSNVLQGMSFVVYEGRYCLRDDEIEMAAAREEGWYDEAQSVKDHSGVTFFIKQHGGTVLLTPDPNCIVLSGQRNNRRVTMHIHAKERAARGGATRSNTSMVGGVVRWTYVYSLVNRLLEKKAQNVAHLAKNGAEPRGFQGSPNTDSIDSTKGTKPSALDYLWRPPDMGEENLSAADSLCREDVSSHIMMWRAIKCVSQEDDAPHAAPPGISGPPSTSWQEEATEFLDPENRWIVSSKRQTLWPCCDGGKAEDACAVFLYPDVYGDAAESAATAVDLQKEKDILESCIPLARVMGALVTTCLDERVTHVLCNLAGDRDMVEYSVEVSAQSFVDPARGQRLLDRLARLTGSSGQDHRPQVGKKPVALVSPAWIRKRKWEGAGT